MTRQAIFGGSKMNLLQPSSEIKQIHHQTSHTNNTVRVLTLLTKMVLESTSSEGRPAALEPENTEDAVNSSLVKSRVFQCYF